MTMCGKDVSLIFSSSHQLIIVDVMMGNYVRVERVMAEGDPIEDISFYRDEETDAFKIAVYNHKYFRLDAFDGHFSQFTCQEREPSFSCNFGNSFLVIWTMALV